MEKPLAAAAPPGSSVRYYPLLLLPVLVLLQLPQRAATVGAGSECPAGQPTRLQVSVQHVQALREQAER
jgi:hypothetical protein